MLEFIINQKYVSIIAILVLTGMGLPIPEEVPIITAGVLASHETLEPVPAFLACLFGALAGDCVLYAIGYHFGHGLAKRHPRFAHLLHAEREEYIERMLRKHGLKVFFLARFMVGIRAPVYLTAGILRMSFRRFLLVDAVCASSVVGLFFGLAYKFGDRINRKIIQRTEIALTVIVSVIVIGVIIYFWRRHQKRKIEAELAMDELPEPKTEPEEMRDAG
jgi:membrane protein DedA with SNARE-associated domain